MSLAWVLNEHDVSPLEARRAELKRAAAMPHAEPLLTAGSSESPGDSGSREDLAEDASQAQGSASGSACARPRELTGGELSSRAGGRRWTSVDRADATESRRQNDGNEGTETYRDGRKIRWTPEEDEYLRTLVQKYGARNWKQIAEKIPNRKASQVRARWSHRLADECSARPFTEEEDRFVLRAVQVHGTKWRLIADMMERRLPHDVITRYKLLLRKQKKESDSTE